MLNVIPFNCGFDIKLIYWANSRVDKNTTEGKSVLTGDVIRKEYYRNVKYVFSRPKTFYVLKAASDLFKARQQASCKLFRLHNLLSWMLTTWHLNLCRADFEKKKEKPLKLFFSKFIYVFAGFSDSLIPGVTRKRLPCAVIDYFQSVAQSIDMKKSYPSYPSYTSQ